MKLINGLAVIFIKITFVTYCFGDGSFQEILNGYKPEISLPESEILYLKSLLPEHWKAAVERSKDFAEQKKVIVALAKENEVIVALAKENENFRLGCTFLKGRHINELLFKNVTKCEKHRYGNKFYYSKVQQVGKTLMKSGLYQVPEDLSAYTNAETDLLHKSKLSFFSHWIPYFEECTLESANALRHFLEKHGMDYTDFSWAMSKTYAAFCEYIHTKTKFAQLMDTPFGYSELIYLDLIRQHNHWILTERDLKCLDLAAEFVGKFKINNFEWFNESRRLAIPILKTGNPLLIFECPTLYQYSKFKVAAPHNY